jgi:8-oxo-dGTP diphosphatase
MGSTNVVCGLIKKGNQFLITRRKLNKSLGGYWEFPGGKIEGSESDIEALNREIKEELGMKIFNLLYFSENLHKYENYTICLRAYLCETNSDPKKLIDHDSYKWCNISEIEEKELAPADVPILKKLRIEFR